MFNLKRISEITDIPDIINSNIIEDNGLLDELRLSQKTEFFVLRFCKAKSSSRVKTPFSQVPLPQKIDFYDENLQQLNQSGFICGKDSINCVMSEAEWLKENSIPIHGITATSSNTRNW
jgi:hypothetical protein